MSAVQARQRLHRLNPGQAPVHVHSAQQRLVEAGLEFVRHQQNLVVVALEGFADLAAFQTRVQVAAGFREGLGAGFLVTHLARESHHGANHITARLDVLLDGQLPAHGLDAAAHHHHGLGLAIEQRRDEGPEVLDDNLHLLRDVVRVQADPAHDALHGGAALDGVFVVILAFMSESERQSVRRVVGKHVEDELLLDGLPHRVHVKGYR
jgi:hypothetical protein